MQPLPTGPAAALRFVHPVSGSSRHSRQQEASAAAQPRLGALGRWSLCEGSPGEMVPHQPRPRRGNFQQLPPPCSQEAAPVTDCSQGKNLFSPREVKPPLLQVVPAGQRSGSTRVGCSCSRISRVKDDTGARDGGGARAATSDHSRPCCSHTGNASRTRSRARWETLLGEESEHPELCPGDLPYGANQTVGGCRPVTSHTSTDFTQSHGTVC